MAYVKLDCGILDSTLWFDRPAREIFITSLLMALPIELETPRPQIAIRSLELTGWDVPPGWYGFVSAAGVGIVARAGVDQDVGLKALERLGAPEPDSRSPEHEGRRLIRVDGGFVILNYMKHRDRDHTTAERSRRYRARQRAERAAVASRETTAPTRDITQAAAAATASANAIKAAAATGDDGPYIRTCVQALNQGMAENETVAGEWMPITASSQSGRVSWREDGILLAVAERVIYERAKVFRSTPRNRGPHTLNYFDAAVREAWEGTEFERSRDDISEALNDL